MPDQGLILKVDLTNEKISQEPVPQEWRRRYLGGEGINARLLWEHFLSVDPKIDPLSPDNVLIVGMGPLVGTGFGAGSKMKFTYKSPAYNMYGDTSSGGGLGSQLRWAGYDHIIITGKAKSPVYLWINDDSVEIRNASHLWGKSVHEADDAIKQELGDGEVEIACIGQAGENLVRVASIIVGCHRAAARGGGGCVFGSKNLKAIAALGTKGIGIHNPQAFFQAIDDFLAARNKDSAARERHMRYGTLAGFRRFHEMGFNTYRNGKGGTEPDEAADKLDHNWYTDNIAVRALACSPGCAFGCGGWYHIKGHESPAARSYAGEWSTKPEYGAINPFGAACDIQDMPAVSHLNKICNNYGIDTMEVGMSVALLMELGERGIITEADVAEWAGEPLSLEWGNYHSVEQIVEAICLQKNMLGKILQGGVYPAACKISELKGVDVLKYASYGKGRATHEGPVRPLPSLGMACALASIGAHHLKGMGISPRASVKFLGKPDAGETLSTTLKGVGHAISENLFGISNSLGLCTFLSGRDPDIVPLELIASALEAVTGTGITAEELYTAGERVVNIEKAFNSRLGLRREHDTLCERWLNEPQLEGMAQGMKASNYLEPAKDEYYNWRGWDKETALQTRQKLEELAMLDVAQVLEKENAIAT